MSFEISEKIAHMTFTEEQDNTDDVVDPWNVVSKSDTGVDYDKLIRE